eukprot:g17507.t1
MRRVITEMGFEFMLGMRYTHKCTAPAAAGGENETWTRSTEDALVCREAIDPLVGVRSGEFLFGVSLMLSTLARRSPFALEALRLEESHTARREALLQEQEIGFKIKAASDGVDVSSLLGDLAIGEAVCESAKLPGTPTAGTLRSHYIKASSRIEDALAGSFLESLSRSDTLKADHTKTRGGGVYFGVLNQLGEVVSMVECSSYSIGDLRPHFAKIRETMLEKQGKLPAIDYVYLDCGCCNSKKRTDFEESRAFRKTAWWDLFQMLSSSDLEVGKDLFHLIKHAVDEMCAGSAQGLRGALAREMSVAVAPLETKPLKQLILWLQTENGVSFEDAVKRLTSKLISEYVPRAACSVAEQVYNCGLVEIRIKEHYYPRGGAQLFGAKSLEDVLKIFDTSFRTHCANGCAAKAAGRHLKETRAQQAADATGAAGGDDEDTQEPAPGLAPYGADAGDADTDLLGLVERVLAKAPLEAGGNQIANRPPRVWKDAGSTQLEALWGVLDNFSAWSASFCPMTRHHVVLQESYSFSEGRRRKFVLATGDSTASAAVTERPRCAHLVKPTGQNVGACKKLGLGVYHLSWVCKSLQRDRWKQWDQMDQLRALDVLHQVQFDVTQAASLLRKRRDMVAAFLRHVQRLDRITITTGSAHGGWLNNQQVAELALPAPDGDAVAEVDSGMNELGGGLDLAAGLELDLHAGDTGLHDSALASVAVPAPAAPAEAPAAPAVDEQAEAAPANAGPLQLNEEDDILAGPAQGDDPLAEFYEQSEFFKRNQKLTEDGIVTQQQRQQYTKDRQGYTVCPRCYAVKHKKWRKEHDYFCAKDEDEPKKKWWAKGKRGGKRGVYGEERTAKRLKALAENAGDGDGAEESGDDAAGAGEA